MVPLSRRRVLGACAAGLVGALAGCVEADVAMSVEPVPTDSDVAERATAGPDPPPDRPSIVADAVDGGTEVAGERPPFTTDRPVAHDGVVYDLTWDETDERRTRTEYVLLFSVGDGDREADVAFEDLPAVDRDRLEFVQRRLEIEEPEDDREITIRRQLYYDEAARERSALVPDPEYEVIEIAGTPVPVEVRETTVELVVYRYEATERAPTLAAFGERLRAAHLFVLDGLGETERTFFESVIEDGSYVDGSPDDGFEGVADRIVAEPAIFADGREGEWLLEYDGADYWVEIDFVRMERYADRIDEVDAVGGGG